MATRFAIATLGCKVNQYDSAIIESRLRARGMERREFTEQADVYIVNTCTITDRADAESLRIARRARRLNPNARVVMTGCLAQVSPDLLAKAAEVDVVVGLGRLDDLERAFGPATEVVEVTAALDVDLVADLHGAPFFPSMRDPVLSDPVLRDCASLPLNV